jgi:hypothetical protein
MCSNSDSDDSDSDDLDSSDLDDKDTRTAVYDNSVDDEPPTLLRRSKQKRRRNQNNYEGKASETNSTCKLTVLRVKPRGIIVHKFTHIITSCSL